MAFGVMAQIRSGIFFGGEARYLRQYDGFGLDSLAGQGFFAGPTLYVKLSERAWITLAWSSQVAGHATAVPGSLDLVNFERQQATSAVRRQFLRRESQARDRPRYLVQSFNAFSSIEKIAPALTSTFGTTQVRPVLSVNLTS